MDFVFRFLDKNGFGRKMLEKFGWSPGEGLGAEKQGIKEHLKVRMKSDNAGNCLGFSLVWTLCL